MSMLMDAYFDTQEQDIDYDLREFDVQHIISIEEEALMRASEYKAMLVDDARFSIRMNLLSAMWSAQEAVWLLDNGYSD